MVVVVGPDKLLSSSAVGKLSKPCYYATAQYGLSEYGQEDMSIPIFEFGKIVFGDCEFGSLRQLSGIFQTKETDGKLTDYRRRHFISKNPRTEDQQNWRQVFQDGVGEWNLLSDAQKKVWNDKALDLELYGFNLFMKDYLLS